MKTSELRKVEGYICWQPAPEDGPALAAEIIRLRAMLKECRKRLSPYAPSKDWTFIHGSIEKLLSEHDE